MLNLEVLQFFINKFINITSSIVEVFFPIHRYKNISSTSDSNNNTRNNNNSNHSIIEIIKL